MRFGKGQQPTVAAVLYSGLLCAPGAPAHSILDALTFSGFMQRVKDACCGRTLSALAAELTLDAEAAAGGGGGAGGSGKDKDKAGGDDDDVAACLGYEAVANLAAALDGVGLRSCADARALCCEALPEIAAGARQAKASAATRAAGLAAGDARAAAYEAMTALLHGRHGSVHEIAAALFPRLSPLLLGAAAQPGARAKGAADANAVRAAACTFVCDALG